MSNQEETTLVIGGEKGHVLEQIEGDLLLLWRQREWKPIKNCTGRYTCRVRKDDTGIHPTELTPIEMIRRATNTVGENKPYWRIQEFGPARGRTDRMLVLPLDELKNTGIITCVKEEEGEGGEGKVRYVHTLNSPSGFQRKLEAVGIQLEED